MDQQIFECPHCGNKTQYEILHKVDAIEESYSVEDPEDVMDFEVFYSLIRCSTCKKISMFLNTEYDDCSVNLSEASLCYPHEREIDKNVPEIIVRNYNEAKKVKRISRPAFAVMIRRGLEFLCVEQNAKGKNLKDKITNLVSMGIIPVTLAEMAETLRFLGNAGAHDCDYEIDKMEVQAMDDFYLAMIEYVYVAPSKLKKIKESIDKKITPR